jgi:hypothetical protein
VAIPAPIRALVAALLAPAGCFYTTAINERPRAELRIAEPGPHYPGDQVVLTAAASSDSEDGNNLECIWTAERCLDARCDDREPIEDLLPATLGCAADYAFFLPRGEHSSIFVRVEVSDTTGAQLSATQIVEVANRPPTVEVQVHAAGTADNAVVGVPVQASVLVADDDGDDVAVLDWRLLKPRGGGADVELEPVAGDGLTQEFTPDQVGLWMVEVTVDDGRDQGTGTGVTSVEEDGAPCATLTSPAAGQAPRLIVRREDGPRAFAVLLVADDLDPYPGPAVPSPGQGEPTFTWQIASPDTGGERVPVAGAVGPELTLDPSTFAPGDLVDLRVEVGDRVERVLSCDDDAPTCSVTGDSSCPQRLSWGVEIR